MDKVYRVYRREPVERGKWYYAIQCQTCDNPIYVLNATQAEVVQPIQFSGKGEISAPCLRCDADSILPFANLKVIQAKEDCAGGRPPRVKASKSSRKPFRRTGVKATPIMGVGYVEDRPAVAAIIGRIITSWADIEVACAMLLAEMMKTDAAPAAAVFGSLRSSRAQQDALNAVALTVLSEADHDLFAAHMARRSALEKERNDLAHGCFGVCIPIKDGIVWASQADYIAFQATFKTDPDALLKFRSKQFVYEEGTLERIAQEIEEFHGQLKSLTGYLWSYRQGPQGEAFRAMRYPQLCDPAHIRQALDRIQLAKGEISVTCA